MNLSNLNVAVVGAAIGGAAASLLLAARGARVTCFERVAEPRAVGAGIALQPNGVAVLAGLGLAPALEALSARIDAPRIVDSGGRLSFAPHTTPGHRRVRSAAHDPPPAFARCPTRELGPKSAHPAPRQNAHRARVFGWPGRGTRALRPRDRRGWRSFPSTSFDDLLVNEVIRVDCRRFVDGHVALIGDAAHAMAPNLGQGANSALVDVAVLCDELTRAATLEAALQAYDRRRRPTVRKVQRTAGTLGWLAERTNPGVRWLRDRLITALSSRGDEQRMRAIFQEAPAELFRMTS